MNTKQQTIDTYNKSAHELASKFDSLGARVEDIDEVFQLVSKTDPSVLEIGCGNGRDAREILKHTHHYVGVDVSEELVKLAQKKNPDASFVVADIESFLFPGNIDVIFAFASLIHSDREHLTKIFSDVYEALADGGIFRVSLKHAHSYEESTKNDGFGTRTYYLYSQDDIHSMAKGFTIMRNDLNHLRDQTWLEVLLQK